MYLIRGRNVNTIFPAAIRQLLACGIKRDSRNGPVTMFPEPVTTIYERPTERVLFCPQRDANPFFHIAEALWMLAGRNDVEFIARYVERMRQYSDDGETFHGAYGYRWREYFDLDNAEGSGDQLALIIKALRHNREDRRQVLTMWDPCADLGRNGKDLPCNLQAIFQVACDGRLDMTVTNRSNDIILGAYGANVVHFSFLQEYMAALIGVPVGVYRQVSANFHAYDGDLAKVRSVERASDPYDETLTSVPLIETDPTEAGLRAWEIDLNGYLKGHAEDWAGNATLLQWYYPFFKYVAAPMAKAYRAHKAKDRDAALGYLTEMPPKNDWRRAGYEWLMRRYGKVS